MADFDERDDRGRNGGRLDERDHVELLRNMCLHTMEWLEEENGVGGLDKLKADVNRARSAGQVLMAKDMLFVMARMYASTIEED